MKTQNNRNIKNNLLWSGLLFAMLTLVGLQRQNLYAETNNELVGPQKTGRVVLPINQILTPAGKQIELPGMRPQV